MKHQAIRNLYPEAHTIISSPTGEEVYDKNGNKISFNKKQVKAEETRLLKEVELNAYKLLRAKEYPPMKDLADALYWSSLGDNSKLEEYYKNCEAVKLKYPKPEVE